MSDQPRKVLIATPAHDGRLDVWYTTSLVNTIRVAQANDIFVHPVFMSYDALVQRARNPMWIMSLLERQEDVVGGTTRKKTDDAEVYVVKASDLTVHDNGLIKAEALGTGFVRLSRKAFLALWDSSPAYQNEGRECRMVCDVQIVDGQLYSEDTILFRKLADLGFDVWLDPRMTCNHLGTKKFCGSFEAYLETLDFMREEAFC
jgi:hypothetical protein